MSDGYESITQIIAPSLGIGWQTALNLNIERAPISGSSHFERDWNGRLVDMSDPLFRLLRFTISSGSDDMRPPALANLWPGSQFSLVPPDQIEILIPVGSSTAIFPRPVHSARALTLGFADVTFTTSGNTVTLSAPATEPVRVYARLQYDVMVTEPWKQSYREADALYNWSIVVEETGGYL